MGSKRSRRRKRLKRRNRKHRARPLPPAASRVPVLDARYDGNLDWGATSYHPKIGLITDEGDIKVSSNELAGPGAATLQGLIDDYKTMWVLAVRSSLTLHAKTLKAKLGRNQFVGRVRWEDLPRSGHKLYGHPGMIAVKDFELPADSEGLHPAWGDAYGTEPIKIQRGAWLVRGRYQPLQPLGATLMTFIADPQLPRKRIKLRYSSGGGHPHWNVSLNAEDLKAVKSAPGTDPLQAAVLMGAWTAVLAAANTLPEFTGRNGQRDDIADAVMDELKDKDTQCPDFGTDDFDPVYAATLLHDLPEHAPDST